MAKRSRWRRCTCPREDLELGEEARGRMSALVRDLREFPDDHWLRVLTHNRQPTAELYWAGMVEVHLRRQLARGLPLTMVRLNIDHPRVLELLWATK